MARRDDIVLDNDIFGALAAGGLKAAAFYRGVRAHDRSDHVIYDETNGVLRYDDDGTGNHKAHIVAVLDTAPHLTAGDFLIVV